MENTGELQPDIVTALIVRRVRPEHLEEFENWVLGMNHVVGKFEGFLGSNVIRPQDPINPEYVIVARFDRYDHLRSFMMSPEREEYIKKSEPLTIGEPSIQEMHGFESFFTLPDHPSYPNSPAKYKMTILTIITLYPLLLGISTILAIIFHGIPRPILILITLLILVPNVTFFIMPWVTRIFKFWLYPKEH
jgi:antibiotic biosynthesis monooxygenase (ABM) superfamily enzyme